MCDTGCRSAAKGEREHLLSGGKARYDGKAQAGTSPSPGGVGTVEALEEAIDVDNRRIEHLIGKSQGTTPLDNRRRGRPVAQGVAYQVLEHASQRLAVSLNHQGFVGKIHRRLPAALFESGKLAREHVGEHR